MTLPARIKYIDVLVADDAKTDNLAKDPAAAARGLAAFSVGLDPKNPYVTQQTNTQFLWYELDVESDGALTGAPDEDEDTHLQATQK